MNDKALNNVPRELLERVSRDVSGREHWDALEPDAIAARQEIRALLTAQPQASASHIGDAAEMVAEGVRDARAGNLTDSEEVRAKWQASAAQSSPAGVPEGWLVRVRPSGKETSQVELASTAVRWVMVVPDSVAKFYEQLAAGQRTQSAPVVPEGWKLVPVEPTLEMVAALGFNGNIDLAIAHGAIGEEVIEQYTEMLAAAPAQPAAHDQGEVQRLREALASLVARCDNTPLEDGSCIDTSHAHAALAASTEQEVKP